MAVGDAAKFHHTCFVVHDLEKAAKALADTLAIKPWSVWTLEPESGTLHAHDATYSMRVALAQVGDGYYELISPHRGNSVYKEHLQAQGEGFHHTCVIYESLEAMQRAKSELAQQGREMIQSGSLGSLGEFCYFDIAETGAALELLYLAGALGPPEKTIE